MLVQTHHHPSHHGVIVLAFSLLIIQFATAQQPQPPPPPPVLPPPPPSYTFSPSMATAVIVLIIFFFCIGFISVYVRHLMTCLGIHLGSESLEIQGWRRNRHSRGLDPAIVDNFPTFLYSDVKTHRIGKSSLECAICLNEFTDLELLRLLPSCCHVFHPHCIGPWLASHVTCPVCRANLESHSSRRSLSFNYLANNQFDQSSEDDDESSVEPSNHHNRDVIVRLGASPQDNMAIKSPAAAVQEIKRADSLTGKLLRSHSTGHSLVEECERYTLRLPDEVRNKLVNINNSSGLPAAIVSPRVGYRARSVGCTKSDGSKPDHWRFSVSPPFISRSNSTKSPKSDSENSNNNNNNSGGIMSGPKSLFKSIKLSPSLNRVTRSDDTGDRSTNRLWDNRTTQDLELEAQWHQNH